MARRVETRRARTVNCHPYHCVTREGWYDQKKENNHGSTRNPPVVRTDNISDGNSDIGSRGGKDEPGQKVWIHCLPIFAGLAEKCRFVGSRE
jgi:hypothetical protein